MLKYPCLVLDHDDTVVQSERTIGYPFFCYILDQYRPGQTVSLGAVRPGLLQSGLCGNVPQTLEFYAPGAGGRIPRLDGLRHVPHPGRFSGHRPGHPATKGRRGHDLRGIPLQRRQHHPGLRHSFRRPPRRNLRLGLPGRTAQAQSLPPARHYGKIPFYPR